MEALWLIIGIFAWVCWSQTRDKPWQSPILYWFILVQICLVTSVAMIKAQVQ